MNKNPMISKLERLIEPAAKDLGYELVRVLLVGSGRPTLQIMAERPDGTMLVDDCEKLSKALSALLDVENALEGAYYLEISSPGIDRPLTRLKDFDTYKGFDARVELDHAIGGAQKKFKGRLLGLKGQEVLMKAENGEDVALPFASIEKAKLLLTDELIKAEMKRSAR